MKFSEAYQTAPFVLSFEMFPPKTEAGEAALFRHVQRLGQFSPRFVTCTYGAGGSTRDKTLRITSEIERRLGCSVAAHLTCVGSPVETIRSYLEEAGRLGIENIVALRGDPPQGESQFKPVAGGFTHADQLVAMTRAEFPQFGIAVGGYPETHHEAPSPEVDLQNLRRKVDSGADLIITQLFYHNEDFLGFRDRCQAIGIDVPIVPGLLPITSLAQIQRITSLCGARLSKPLVDRLRSAGEDTDAQFEAGVEFAAEQTRGLIEAGVPGIHYYVLNQSRAATHVLNSVTLPS
ncbi:MAG: methylenetetrahydrofolate reductase [NAD(P)H] [Pirellulales bacterium]